MFNLYGSIIFIQDAEGEVSDVGYFRGEGAVVIRKVTKDGFIKFLSSL